MAPTPNDFPRYLVPGHEKEMQTVRDIYWLHYPGSGPKSTMWDEWLPMPGLWPAVDSDGFATRMRDEWAKALSGRILDSDGYVATQQHPSIAHQLGWPFPFWNQGVGGMGWHFSFQNTVGPPWRQGELNKPDDWTLEGAKPLRVSDDGWELKLTQPKAAALTPLHEIDTFQAPFMQLRWKAKGLDHARPFLEWRSKGQPFDAERRMYFEPAADSTVFSMVPMFKHPKWTGTIEQLRIGFDNETSSADVTIQAFFTQYDTRHNINGLVFVLGCSDYYKWTGDINFLRKNMNRMRTALHYVMTEHQALQRKMVYTSNWFGHDGQSGLEITKDGKKVVHSGRGIGNNYWDLMPFGGLDAYATIRYYAALRAMADIELTVKRHPEWDIPTSVMTLDSDFLMKHAKEVRAEGNKHFWNAKTGRFAACIDSQNKQHDYGFTFLNLESIAYGFASAPHAKQIMDWIDGDRSVDGDTSQGADIYHWRFGPRATTRRNIDWYTFGWTGPESIPWGGQIQDGGAVFGFTFYDLMARLEVNGPDDVWSRLQEIIGWFQDVQQAGGYREYYKSAPRGATLQGGGTAGGLGVDHEFFESVLAPQIMLQGFLGFMPTVDGFVVNPRLPASWPELTINRIHYRQTVLQIKATPNEIRITADPGMDDPCFVWSPGADWTASSPGKSSQPVRQDNGSWKVDWQAAKEITFSKGRK